MSENRRRFNCKARLDQKLVRKSLIEHRLFTGKWLAASHKEAFQDSPGSYVLKHGSYEGKVTARILESSLRNGLNGLKTRSSLNNETELMAKFIADSSNLWVMGRDHLAKFIDLYRDELLHLYDNSLDNVKTHISGLSYEGLLEEIVRTYHGKKHPEKELVYNPVNDESLASPKLIDYKIN